MAVIPPFDTNLPADNELISQFPYWIRRLEGVINQLIVQAIPAGTIKTGFYRYIPDGWVGYWSGGTVGKGDSGANLASDDFYNLFSSLWGGASVTTAIMTDRNGNRIDSRVDSLADWNAGNKISMPPLDNRALVASTGAQESVGINFGVDSLQIVANNLPSHYLKTNLPVQEDTRLSIDDVHKYVGNITNYTPVLTDGNVYYRDAEGNEQVSQNAAIDIRQASTTVKVIIKY